MSNFSDYADSGGFSDTHSDAVPFADTHADGGSPPHADKGSLQVQPGELNAPTPIIRDRAIVRSRRAKLLDVGMHVPTFGPLQAMAQRGSGGLNVNDTTKGTAPKQPPHADHTFQIVEYVHAEQALVGDGPKHG